MLPFLLVVAEAITLGGPHLANASEPRALLVCQPCPPETTVHFSKVQSAVDAANSGDWILIWPGHYRETVNVATDRLHIRGMDRNGVILDGERQRARGIAVEGVTESWIENLTAQNYQYIAISWSEVSGLWGSYLTGTNNHDYALWAFASSNHPSRKGLFYRSYAAGNGEAGFYVGGCQPCHMVVAEVLGEHNAGGFANGNAGGDLTLMNSEFRDNYVGIATLTTYGGPYSGRPFTLQRESLIYQNYVHENNNLNAPNVQFTSVTPVGIGILVGGGSTNIIEQNRVEDHKHYGIALNWFLTASTSNKVLRNVLSANRDADLAMDAASFENCFSQNKGRGGEEPTSDPPRIQTLYSCANPVTGPGSPTVALLNALNGAGITEPKSPKEGANSPAWRESMANPCAGVPNNDWCQGGLQVVSFQRQQVASLAATGASVLWPRLGVLAILIALAISVGLQKTPALAMRYRAMRGSEP